MSDSLLDSILDEAAGFAVASSGVVPPLSSAVASGASPFSSTITSRVVGVEGGMSGLKGKVSSAKSYSVLSVRASDRRTMCMGVMSKVGSLSFCIRKNCGTKSHIANKFEMSDPEEPYLFIVRVPGSNVFSEPSVRESLVPRAVLDEWRGTATTLTNWVKAFRAVVITEEVVRPEVYVASEFKETKFLDDAESFRTPFKKRKGFLGDEQGSGSDVPLKGVKFVRHERSLPDVEETEEMEALLAGGSLGKGRLTRIVSEVESSVVTLGEAMEEVTMLTQQRFLEHENETKAMAGVLQNLFATLGPTAEIDASLEAPTLWGTTAFIAEDVIRLGGVVGALQAELNPMSEAIKEVSEAQKMASASINSSDKIIKVLSLVMSHVRKVGSELDNLKETCKRLEAEVNRSGSEGPGRPRSSGVEVDSMDSLMTMLKESARVGDGIDRDGDHLDSATIGAVSLRKILGDIDQLVEDVSMLKACAEDTAVRFGGLGLKSLQECHVWVAENFEGHRYGLVMDPLLMMERIFGGDCVDGRDNHLKVLESRMKLKIQTGAEAAAISALAYARPRQFHNGKVAMTTERNSSRLSKLPNYKSWNSGGQGVRNYVTKQMNLIQGTVSHDIAYTFGRGSSAGSLAAHSLATMSLNATVTFLTQLLVFVDTLYEKLHVDSRFSADQSWSLTTQILDRICEELYAPKEGVQEAMTIEDPASICSHVLWSCLKTHDIMTGYIEHQFENHPTIAAEYVKFLATNSGHDKVDKLEEAVKEVKEDLAAAVKSSRAAVAKADGGAGKSDAVKTALDALAKRVKSLEDRK
ncbi:hypothetical protein MHU86_17543 [Fragilaria crotonensis]|nr:hypothetical protein MHU86_17543 [Fragilaria crotonensis]